eukprot:tig00001224_g7632.t1
MPPTAPPLRPRRRFPVIGAVGDLFAGGGDLVDDPMADLQKKLTRTMIAISIVSISVRALAGIYSFNGAGWRSALELAICLVAYTYASCGGRHVCTILVSCSILALPAALMPLREVTSAANAASLAAAGGGPELEARLAAAQIRACSFEMVFYISMMSLMLAMCCPLLHLGIFGAVVTAGVAWATHQIEDPLCWLNVWSNYGVTVATTGLITFFVRESQRRLLEALVHAREAADAKDRFTANITHELRTPLTAIIGMSELMSEYPMPDDQRSLLDIMATAASGMLELVNDLLDFAKIQFGAAAGVRAERFVLVPFLCSLMDVLWGRFMGGPVALRLLVAPAACRVAVGDSHKLRQILMNLLSNACKFTSEGEVCMRVWVASTEEEAGAAATLGPAEEPAGPGAGADGRASSSSEARQRAGRPRHRSRSRSGSAEGRGGREAVSAPSSPALRTERGPSAGPRPRARAGRGRGGAGRRGGGGGAAGAALGGGAALAGGLVRLAAADHPEASSRPSSGSLDPEPVASRAPSSSPPAPRPRAPAPACRRAPGRRRLWLSLAVADTGRGIAPEDAPKLFQRFSQLGDVMLNKNKGTGLGLAIVDGLVRELGGRIDVRSVLGQGSTFTCTVPLEDAGPDEHLDAFRACPPCASPAISSASGGAGPPCRPRRPHPPSRRGRLGRGASAMRRPFEPLGRSGRPSATASASSGAPSASAAARATTPFTPPTPPPPTPRLGLRRLRCAGPGAGPRTPPSTLSCMATPAMSPLASPLPAPAASAGALFALGPGALTPTRGERVARVEEAPGPPPHPAPPPPSCPSSPPATPPGGPRPGPDPPREAPPLAPGGLFPRPPAREGLLRPAPAGLSLGSDDAGRRRRRPAARWARLRGARAGAAGEGAASGLAGGGAAGRRWEPWRGGRGLPRARGGGAGPRQPRRASAAEPHARTVASGASAVWGWRIGRRPSSPAVLGGSGSPSSPRDALGGASPSPPPPARLAPRGGAGGGEGAEGPPAPAPARHACRVLLADDEQARPPAPRARHWGAGR